MYKLSHAIRINDVNQYDEMIFENGQGLLLCDTGVDSYEKTPSKTGIEYAANIITDIGLEHFDELSLHYVTRPYLTRHGENENVCYSKIITGRRFPYRQPSLIHDTAIIGYGPVEAVGFGFCLIKCSVLKSMFKRYKSIFEPKWGVGEDIAFCIRAKKCGYKIFIDRDIKLGHIGEKVYQ
jgi:hypothetical protein